ncbi:MAG: hypothetical protein NTX11_01145 [Candidatus Saccharibacteria bacterium]|nr:hypothetical protein [Candidatus Saccharibacteria bacterium]
MSKATLPNSKSRRQFAVYLLTAYFITYFIERSAANKGDSKLFQASNWPIRFLLWYGFLFTIMYLVFRYRSLKTILLWGILIGIVIELVLFRGFFLVSDIGYGLMFVVPFWVARKFVKYKS